MTEKLHPRGSLGSIHVLDEPFVRDGFPVPPLDDEGRGEFAGVRNHGSRRLVSVPREFTGLFYDRQGALFRGVVHVATLFFRGVSYSFHISIFL